MNRKEYLIKQGYKEIGKTLILKKEEVNDNVSIPKYISLKANNFFTGCYMISKQKEIDTLQIAFNNVKRDFEECMKYE